jgi:hypothetical protein
MTISTHYRIGGFIFEKVILKNSSSSFFEKKVFQYGNILPDIDGDLSHIKHQKEQSSIPMLYHEKIAKDIFESNSQRLKSLGIICHYLTDFFCIFHSREKYKNSSIILHILYEMAIDVALFFMLLFPNRLYKNLHLPDVSSSTKKQSHEPSFSLSFEYGKEFDIRDLLNTMEKQYNRAGKNIINDIYFSLKISCLTVATILKDNSLVHWGQFGGDYSEWSNKNYK